MKPGEVVRDERSISVENASYRWAYLLLSFGLLAIVAYRGLVAHESNWDLMALVVAGGLLATLYQASCRVLTRPWIWMSAVTFLIAIVVAIGIVIKW